MDVGVDGDGAVVLFPRKNGCSDELCDVRCESEKKPKEVGLNLRVAG